MASSLSQCISVKTQNQIDDWQNKRSVLLANPQLQARVKGNH